jgi:hypothetical protein
MAYATIRLLFNNFKQSINIEYIHEMAVLMYELYHLLTLY